VPAVNSGVQLRHPVQGVNIALVFGIRQQLLLKSRDLGSETDELCLGLGAAHLRFEFSQFFQTVHGLRTEGQARDDIGDRLKERGLLLGVQDPGRSGIGYRHRRCHRLFQFIGNAVVIPIRPEVNRRLCEIISASAATTAAGERRHAGRTQYGKDENAFQRQLLHCYHRWLLSAQDVNTNTVLAPRQSRWSASIPGLA